MPAAPLLHGPKQPIHPQRGGYGNAWGLVHFLK